MEPMWRSWRGTGITAAVLATLALLGIAGCGALRPADPDVMPDRRPTTVDQGQSAPRGALGPRDPGATAAAPISPMFPLTLRRTGGIAQFDDTVVLTGDGRVTVRTRTVSGRVCTLPEPLRTELTASLGTVPMTGTLRTAPPATGAPDSAVEPGPTLPITISVTDARERNVDLSHPSLGRIASIVGAVVADVTLTSPALSTCSIPARPSLPPTLSTP